MSSALLRWISSKGWPSDGAMTAMLRPETDATQALAIWFSCMGRYFARNPIAVLCWQKTAPWRISCCIDSYLFCCVSSAGAGQPGAGAHRFAMALRVSRDTCAGRGPRQPAGAAPVAPPRVRGRRLPGGRRFTSSAVESDHQRHDQQRHDVDDLDQRVDRRACRVFVGVAHGVAGHGRLVRLAALAAMVAVFDVLLGVVPGAAAGAHADGHEQAGDDG